MREHETVNRPYPPQTICPFVEASIKANCFYMVFHNEIMDQMPQRRIFLRARDSGGAH